MANNMVLQLLLSAKDRMSSPIHGAVVKSQKDFEALQNRIKSTSDTLNTIGTRAMVAGAAIGAPFVIGVKKAADFGAELSNIKALTGENAQNMALLRELALKMGADTQYSALESAQGMSELLKAGLSVVQVMNGGIQGALTLAAAGDIELAASAEIASTALNAFKADNLTVSQAADILAGAANASATGVSELQYSLASCSAVASGFGMSFMDTNTALAVFAQNGLKGSDAGTSLKSMLMNLQPRTDAQIATMVKLGLATGRLTKVTKSGKEQYQLLSNAFYDSNGKIKSIAEISGLLHDKLKHLTSQQRLYALETIFGADAIRAANILYTEGAQGVQNMAASMKKVSAAEVAAEKMNNLKGSIEELSGSIETISIKFGDRLVPGVDFVTKLLTAATNAFGSMPEPVQSAIAITGAFSAATLIAAGGASLLAGAALNGFNEFLGAYRKVSEFVGKHKISIPDMKFTLSGKPLAQGIDFVIKNFVRFGDSIDKNVQKFIDVMNFDVTGWAKTVPQNLSIAGNTFKDFVKSGLENTIARFDVLKNAIKLNAGVMVQTVQNGLSGMVAGFKNLPSNILNSSKQLFNFIKTQFIMLPANLANGYNRLGKSILGLKTPLKSARAAMMRFNLVVSANPIGLVVLAIAGAAFLIYKYWKPITGFFRGLWAGIVESTRPLHPMFNKIALAVKPIIDWFKKLIKPVDDAGGKAENFGKRCGKAIGGVINWVVNLIKKVEKLNIIFHPSQWGKRENEIDKNLAAAGDRGKTPAPKVDGSHAAGLAYVPFNGYIAELHKGERVLTKEENSAFSGLGASGGIMLTYAPTIYADAQTDVSKIKKMLEEHERKMFERLKTEQRRREVRAYA